MDFGGFNSADKTPPSPSFSPVLDISSPSRILVRNPFAPASFSLFRRNMRMGRESFDDLLRLMYDLRSLRDPYLAK